MVFPHFKQTQHKSCGPTCLYIISSYYQKEYSKRFINDLCPVSTKGVSLAKLCNSAQKIGFSTTAVRGSLRIFNKANLPCIALLNGNHYVVVYGLEQGKVFVSDPANGLMSYPRSVFISMWYNAKTASGGIALLLTPKIQKLPKT